MFSNAPVAVHGRTRIRVFGIKVAEHVEGDYVTRLVVDDLAVFTDGIAELSL